MAKTKPKTVETPVEAPPVPVSAKKPWPQPDEVKVTIAKVHAELARYVSIYDVIFDSIKLGLLLTAIGWIVGERFEIPVFVLGLACGAMGASWLFMKIFPHVLHLCELDGSTSEKMLWLRFWKAFLITMLLCAAIAPAFGLGVWVGIEQLRKI